MKLLVAPHATPTLAAMADAGLLLRVLGGVPYLAGFENMAKVEAAVGVQRRIRCSGSARSACMVAEDAERLWQKLRLTNAEHERLASMAEGWRRMSPAKASRRRARCSTGWARSISPITRCSPGRAQRRHDRSCLARSPRCRSAGPRRCFR